MTFCNCQAEPPRASRRRERERGEISQALALTCLILLGFVFAGFAVLLAVTGLSP